MSYQIIQLKLDTIKSNEDNVNGMIVIDHTRKFF